MKWLPPTAPEPARPRTGPQFERNDDALRILLYVFSAIVVVDILAIVSGAFELHLASRMLDGLPVTKAESDHNDLRQAIVGGLETLMLVIGAFVWLSWFHGTYSNVTAVGAKRRFGPGWAIGAWFVPILSLWRPKQIANDMWAAGEEGAQPAQAPPVMLLWWLIWLLGNGVGGAYARLSSDTSATQLRNAAVADMVSATLNGIAAVLACVVAIQIGERLEARASAQRGAQPHQQLP
ncbi:MAG: hypothetical protein QOF76_5055 [Solirubrobacteraceae bacterium]|nr:hypothetical protein [Solirubrobacteraceae bacterium]